MIAAAAGGPAVAPRLTELTGAGGLVPVRPTETVPRPSFATVAVAVAAARSAASDAARSRSVAAAGCPSKPVMPRARPGIPCVGRIVGTTSPRPAGFRSVGLAVGRQYKSYDRSS